ncbi:MAG TPA: hypothetical protein VFZ24_09850, partial [Longimicrobiales bacterium]
ATPCCAVIAIDRATGVATARSRTGETFRFEVKDAALLRSLRVGQSVAADFGTGKVTVNGAQPCCAIIRPAEPVGRPGVKPAEPVNTKQVKPAEPVGKPNADPAEPCCGITAIDLATGIVTAREAATGRVFRFEVKDAALLRSLKIGQKVYADFGTSKVRIHGLEPCCGIIGHGRN